MTELTTGAIVQITGHVIKHKPFGARETALLKITYSKPIAALILGKSQRQTGKLVYGSGEYDQNYLTDVVSHPVWIVMPIAKRNYFRKPIAILLEQVQP